LCLPAENKRSLAPIRALKTARPHGRDLGMTILFDKAHRCSSRKNPSFAKS
jgi:hypothetical protein